MSGTFNVPQLSITSASVTGLLKALGGFKFPQYTTATRPSNPVVGQTIFNTDEDSLEVWDSTEWQVVSGGGALPTWSTKPTSGLIVGLIGWNTTTSEVDVYDGSDWVSIETAAATGGGSALSASGGDNTYTPGDGYKYHVFTSDGTFTVASGTDDIEYIVLAGGGGGGGGDVGCGGGAGGYRANVRGFPSGGGANAEEAMSISPGSYPVVVGDGGQGSNSSPSDADSGQDSSFNGITSLGGGGGASWGSGTGRVGGSGGGSASTRTGAAGTTGQGYAGGSGRGSPNYPQGGGGGAGGAGQPSINSSNAGCGGVGLHNPFGDVTGIGEAIGGDSYWLAGGGGGGVESNAQVGFGGLGGGGIGGRQSPNTNPSPGLANTGGGGGGEDSGRGGNGGSGVVILRYASE